MILEKDKYYSYNNSGFSYLFKVVPTTHKGSTDFIALRISGIKPCFEPSSTFYSLEQYCMLATQEQIYWLDACIAANKYIPQSEVKPKLEPNKVEVFPGWFVGDVVVRVEAFPSNNSFGAGSLTSIHYESLQDRLVIYWEGKKIGSHWRSPSSFRKATTEEIEAFNHGITNTKDMKKVETMFMSKYGEVNEEPKPKKLLGAALIAEAKVRFPIGTKVMRCLTGHSPDQSFIVKDYNQYYLHEDAKRGDIWVNTNLGGAVIHRGGKWAEIVGNPSNFAIRGDKITDKYYPSPKKVKKKHDEPIIINKPKKITRLVVVKN